MPYIPDDARDHAGLDDAIDALIEAGIRGRNGAALNYALSRLAGAAVEERHCQEVWRSAYTAAVGHYGNDSRAFEAADTATFESARPGYEARAAVYGDLAAFLREFERRVLDDHEARKATANDVPEYARLSS